MIYLIIIQTELNSVSHYFLSHFVRSRNTIFNVSLENKIIKTSLEEETTKQSYTTKNKTVI